MDRIRVMLADDNLNVLRLLTDYLSRKPDIEVVAAVSDGVEIPEGVREHAPDILVMDIIMPRRDGFMTLEALNGMEPSLRPKVIVEYTRTPFIYKAGNVRVTLDCNIRSGVFSTDLFNPASLVHTGDMDVLEVKYDRFLPDIVKMAIYPIGHDRESMSKYEVCRKFG
jgi:CheY-like chemotaxis protein